MRSCRTFYLLEKYKVEAVYATPNFRDYNSDDCNARKSLVNNFLIAVWRVGGQVSRILGSVASARIVVAKRFRILAVDVDQISDDSKRDLKVISVSVLRHFKMPKWRRFLTISHA